jgi:hypothetical protein
MKLLLTITLLITFAFVSTTSTEGNLQIQPVYIQPMNIFDFLMQMVTTVAQLLVHLRLIGRTKDDAVQIVVIMLLPFQQFFLGPMDANFMNTCGEFINQLANNIWAQPLALEQQHYDQ